MAYIRRLLVCLVLALVGFTVTPKELVAAPTVKGSIYKSDGTLDQTTTVTIDVYDTATPNNKIGTGTAGAGGTYSVTFNGNPQADNIIVVKYSRNGTLKVTVNMSYLPQVENFSPIVP